MIVSKKVKVRFGNYIADLLMNFLRLCKHRALIEPLLTSVDNQSSSEYIRFHNVIKEGFIKGFDDTEMALVFEEVEKLIHDSPDDLRRDGTAWKEEG